MGLSGCAVVGQVTELPANWYQVPHLGGSDSLEHTLRHQRVYARLSNDTLLLTPEAASEASYRTLRYPLQQHTHALLVNRLLDIDVFTVPFKARLPRAGVPPQLNAAFNAALYVGRRLDFFYLSAERRRQLPGQRLPHIKAIGLGYGAFLGLGSAFISPDLTQQHASLEYDGLVVNAGLAALYDARVFNLGLAVGIDHLAGPDRGFWIYQDRPRSSRAAWCGRRKGQAAR